jgi:hypothetical protein
MPQPETSLEGRQSVAGMTCRAEQSFRVEASVGMQ